MKKRLVFIGLMLLSGALWAQSNRNVLGAPVYYDTLGNVIGQSAPADSFYHRPKHHFLNRLEDDFSAFFLEGQMMLGGRDMAIGGQFAYVPRRWGAYVGGNLGFQGGYLKAGPVWRMSDCGNDIDWQLYAGVNICRHPGAEIGLRMGAPRLWGDFCWTSYSMTVGYANRSAYLTLGFSLSLTAILALAIW
ncbi:MAG: hypothetical protein IJ524_01255 [Bacteroidales bacterium]|nr:hypothetical protein [Bacteroidales bacterium]